MDYKYISQLLDRYWQGETTLEEEQILRSFFSQLCIPEELQKYRSLFIYEQTEKHTNTLGDDFDERMMALIDEPETVKARRVTMKERFAPFFKAAAMGARRHNTRSRARPNRHRQYLPAHRVRQAQWH